MSNSAIILVGGFILINVLSLIIKSRVKRHLSARFASYTHLFVAFLGLYYLLDSMFEQSTFYSSVYFYFWLCILLMQIVLFLISLKNISS